MVKLGILFCFNGQRRDKTVVHYRHCAKSVLVHNRSQFVNFLFYFC